jgi:hypothetical protein
VHLVGYFHSCITMHGFMNVNKNIQRKLYVCNTSVLRTKTHSFTEEGKVFHKAVQFLIKYTRKYPPLNLKICKITLKLKIKTRNPYAS